MPGCEDEEAVSFNQPRPGPPGANKGRPGAPGAAAAGWAAEVGGDLGNHWGRQQTAAWSVQVPLCLFMVAGYLPYECQFLGTGQVRGRRPLPAEWGALALPLAEWTPPANRYLPPLATTNEPMNCTIYIFAPLTLPPSQVQLPIQPSDSCQIPSKQPLADSEQDATDHFHHQLPLPHLH